MTAIPKTRIRRTLGRDTFTAFFGPARHRWEVTLDGHPIAEFDNHPDALAYAHWLVSKLRRVRLTDVETDGDVVTYSYTANVRDLDELPQLMRAAELRSRLMLGASR